MLQNRVPAREERRRAPNGGRSRGAADFHENDRLSAPEDLVLKPALSIRLPRGDRGNWRAENRRKAGPAI